MARRVMIGSRDIAHLARRHAGAIVGVCALTYFGYHLLLGERGLGAWVRLGDELAIARADLEVRQAEQRDLEHKVGLMRPESLDPDMLDEQVRAVLGYAREDEVVIQSGEGG